MVTAEGPSNIKESKGKFWKRNGRDPIMGKL